MSHQIKETDTHVVLQVQDGDGTAYEVGYPKEGGYSAEKLESDLSANGALTQADDSFKSLNWVPGKDGYTSPQAEEIGIAQGYVSHDRGVIYKYRINFQNSKGWQFKFKDESGDVYSCVTIRNGWHYIDYNSDRPIVTGVA